jgi:hypothetical protein
MAGVIAVQDTALGDVPFLPKISLILETIFHYQYFGLRALTV